MRLAPFRRGPAASAYPKSDHNGGTTPTRNPYKGWRFLAFNHAKSSLKTDRTRKPYAILSNQLQYSVQAKRKDCIAHTPIL
jgi:hypothetical protein